MTPQTQNDSSDAPALRPGAPHRCERPSSERSPAAPAGGAVPRRPGARALRRGLCLLAAVGALGVACSDDDAEPGGGQCIGGEGAVAGEPDAHCVADDGSEVVQAIGICATGGAAEEGEEHEHEEGEEHAEGEEHEHEEGEEHEHEEGEHEHPILFGREADDDDCKYHVRFENTCVAVNEPVTFTLSLTRKFDGMPGAGTNPAYPEVFFASEDTHISPSTNITAIERSPGTYDIGPIVFDRSGRWVIRFHYFESCSDLPADSPHGHVAFYIDVP